MTVKIISQLGECTHVKCILGATSVKPVFHDCELIGLEVNGVVYTSDYFASFEITNDPEDKVEVDIVS